MGWDNQALTVPLSQTCTTVVVTALVAVVTAGQGTPVPAAGMLAVFA